MSDDDGEEDEEEPTFGIVCANCKSESYVDPCTVCGHRVGAPVEADSDVERARRLVRMLVASNGIALVSPSAEAGLVSQTAFVLREGEAQSAEHIAEILEEAWMSRDDVAEIFVDAEGIAEAIRKSSG